MRKRQKAYLGSIDLILVVLFSKLICVLGQTTCNNGQGRVLYERLPNQQLQGFDDDVVRDSAPPFRVLEKCQDLCLRDRTASNNLVRACTSFDFQPGSRIASFTGMNAEYEESTCYLTREQAAPEGIGNLMLVPNSVHFTEVCLSSSRPERECPNRRYVFERLPRKKLKLPLSDIKEMTAANRSDCEDKCLNEFSFVCRSANFDSTLRSCTMSRFTRRTQPEFLEDDPNSDYLENTCLNAERRCDGLIVFVKEENKRLGGPFEVDIFNNMTLEECQSMCLRAEKYFCRSVEYDDQTKQCILSEEDSVSQKDDLSISSSPTHHFYDLVCLDNQRGLEYPDNSLTSHLFSNGRKPDTAFQRFRNSRLGGEFHSEITGRSLSECLDECLRQTSFQCRSAVYSDRFRTCRLSRYNQKDGMRIIYDADYDYYENLMPHLVGGETEPTNGRPDPTDWRPPYPDDRNTGRYPTDNKGPSDFNGYPSSPTDRYPGITDKYPVGSDHDNRYPPVYDNRFPSDRYPPTRFPERPGGAPYSPESESYPKRPELYPDSRYPPNRGGYTTDRYHNDRPPDGRYPENRYPVEPTHVAPGRYPSENRYPTRGPPSYPDSRYPEDNNRGYTTDRYPVNMPYPRPDDRYPHTRYPPTFLPPRGYTTDPPYQSRPQDTRYPSEQSTGRYPSYGSGYSNRDANKYLPPGIMPMPQPATGYGYDRYPMDPDLYRGYGNEPYGTSSRPYEHDRGYRRPQMPPDSYPPYEQPTSSGYDNTVGGGDGFGGLGPQRPFGTRCDESENFKQVGSKRKLRSKFIKRVINARSLGHCQEECVNIRDFVCRSFNYKDNNYDDGSGGNCELSDHDTRDPDLSTAQMFEADSSDYYERMASRSDECLDVGQVCNEDGMEFTLRTPEGFFGRIYSYGFYDRCFFRGNGGTINVLRISGPQGYPECGTQRYGDTMTNIIVVQFSDHVQTGRDKRFNLTCMFRGPGEAVVTSGYIGAGSGSPIPIEYLPAENSMTNKVRLMILYQGRPTTTIAVGDPLTFRLETHDGYNHANDLFATNVVARDPYSGRSVQLIDRYGCPVDSFVFPELGRSRDNDALEARFNAFKIPESNFLVFEATVRTCRDGCQPAYCPGPSGRSEPSFGRRKRSANETILEDKLETDISENFDDDTISVVNATITHDQNSTNKGDKSDSEKDITNEELPEHVREMIEVFESREEMQQDSVARKLIAQKETVCLRLSEYHGLITGVILMMILLLSISLAAGLAYRKYWAVVIKNRNLDRPIHSFSPSPLHVSPGSNQSYSTSSHPRRYSTSKDNIRTTPAFSLFSHSLQKTFATGNLSRMCQIPVMNPIRNSLNSNDFDDPSEPIYTDPSLFERSRSLRSIAVNQSDENIST